MTERKETLKENNLGVSVVNSHLKEQLTKIKGTLTSQIRQRKEETSFFTSPYYYAFVKLKGHGADLPVIFKVKKSPDLFVVTGSWNLEPQLKKGDLIELTGYYSNSDKNIRKSFTCLAYQVIKEENILSANNHE